MGGALIYYNPQRQKPEPHHPFLDKYPSRHSPQEKHTSPPPAGTIHIEHIPQSHARQWHTGSHTFSRVEKREYKNETQAQRGRVGTLIDSPR